MSRVSAQWIGRLAPWMRPVGGGAAAVVLFTLACFWFSTHRPQAPWLAVWVTAALVAIVAAGSWGHKRDAAEQSALAAVLSLLALGTVLHGLHLVARQATQSRVEVRGEYRPFLPGKALSFGREGSDVPLEFSVPGWGTPRFRVTPLASARRDGGAYALTDMDSVDFVWQKRELLFGRRLRGESWLRVEGDSVLFRPPGLLARLWGRGPELEYRGRTLPLPIHRAHLLGIDIGRGATLGELLGERRNVLSRSLQLIRLHRSEQGGDGFHVSYPVPSAFLMDGRRLQDTIYFEEGEEIQVGTGPEAPRFVLERRDGPHGTDVLFLRYVRAPGVRRWQLPSDSEPGLAPAWKNRLVMATAPVPGPFSLLDLSGLPLAARSPGILGRLDRSEDSGRWDLTVGNRGWVDEMDFVAVTPDGRTGFLLARRDAPLSLLAFALLVTALWATAVGLPIWSGRPVLAGPSARSPGRHPIFASRSLLFCVFPTVLMLLAVRTVLAARAAYLPPHRDLVLGGAVLGWLLFPAFVLLLVWWPRLEGLLGRRPRVRIPRPAAGLVLAYVLGGSLACALAAPPGTGARARAALHFLLYLVAFPACLYVLARVLTPRRHLVQRTALDSPLAPVLQRRTASLPALLRGREPSLIRDVLAAIQGESWRAMFVLFLLVGPILLSGVSVWLGRLTVVATAVYFIHRLSRLRQVQPRWRGTLPLLGGLAVFFVTFWVPFSMLRVTSRYLMLLSVLLVIGREFAIRRWKHQEHASPPPRGSRAWHGRWRTLLEWTVPVGVSLVLLGAVAVTDFGIALYILPVLVSILILAFAASFRVGALLGGVLVVMMGVGYWYAVPDVDEIARRARTLQNGPTAHLSRFVEELRGGLGPVSLRHAATFYPDLLERSLVFAATAEEERGIRRTVEHWWGMRSYSRQGWLGRGLGGAPIEGRGIPVAVSLSDNSFATLILAEQGGWGAGVVLLLYAVLFGAAIVSLIRGRPHHPGDDHAAVLALGAALGLFFLVPAFYLAASNAVLVPLTGQNVPFLALNSPADIFFATAVAALLVVLVGGCPWSGDRDPEPGVGRAVRTTAGVAMAAAAAGLVIGAGIVKASLADAPGHLEYRGLRDELEQVARAGVLAFDPAGDSIAIRGTGPLASLASSEQAFLGRNRTLFNLDRRGVDRQDTLFSRAHPSVFQLAQAARAPVLVARPAEIYGMRDPLTEGRAVWRGALTGAGKRRPTMLLLGPRLTVFLVQGGPDLDLGPGECRTGGVFTAGTVSLRCGAASGSAYVAWQAPERVAVEAVGGRRGGVLLNDRPVGGTVEASPGDLLAVPGIGSLVVDSGETGLLSGARWANGKLVRFATSEFVLSRALAWRIDEGMHRHGGAPDRDVELSLNLPLSSRLGRGLAEYARSRPAVALGIRAAAVTVMDAQTGEVVALAGWSDTGAAAAGGAACPDSSVLDPEAMPSATALQLNFSTHFPGSTVKPFLAVAALSRYPWLRDLRVTHPGAPNASIISRVPSGAPGWPGLDIGTEWQCVRRHAGAGMVITPELFLACSSNLYAATLTFLGSSTPDPDNGARPDFVTATRPGYRVQIGGRPAAGRPAVAGLGRCDGVRCRISSPRALGSSPIAEELSELFGVVTAGNRAGLVTGGAFDTGMWASLQEAGMFTSSQSRRNQVSACATTSRFDQIGFTDQLARHAIGAQENRWTNVRLAEGFARILTGRRVEATMVRRVAGESARPAVSPMPGDSVWREPVRVGLLRTVDQGTADALAPFAADVQDRLARGGRPVGGHFDLAAKTGTLNDRSSHAHLKVLLLGAGLWNASPAPIGMRCGVTVVLHVAFRPGPSLPNDHLQIARDVVLPALAENFGWANPERARRCYAGS